MSVILVTHDIAVVQDYAQRIVIMYAGTTVEADVTDTVLGAPAHPYTAALLAARPSAGSPGARLVGIPGSPPSPRAWPMGCRFAPRCDRRTVECELARPLLHPDMHGAGVACLHPLRRPE